MVIARSEQAGRSAGLSAAFVVLWSSGFIGAELSADSNIITVLAWRFVIVGLVMTAVLWAVGRGRAGARQALSGAQVRLNVALGVLSQVIYLSGTVGAVAVGVPAGTTALVAALQPIAVAALAGPVLGDRVHRAQWVGLLLGLVGVGLVVGADAHGSSEVSAWAYLLPFAGMAGLVAATLLERRAACPTPPLPALTVQCATSAVVFGALAIVTGGVTPPSAHATSFWTAVAWFIVFSTVGGYGTYWALLRRTDVTRVSALIYLTPATTMVWSFVMFDEHVPALAAPGIAISLFAACLVHVGGRRRSGRRERREVQLETILD